MEGGTHASWRRKTPHRTAPHRTPPGRAKRNSFCCLHRAPFAYPQIAIFSHPVLPSRNMFRSLLVAMIRGNRGSNVILRLVGRQLIFQRGSGHSAVGCKVLLPLVASDLLPFFRSIVNGHDAWVVLQVVVRDALKERESV